MRRHQTDDRQKQCWRRYGAIIFGSRRRQTAYHSRNNMAVQKCNYLNKKAVARRQHD